MYVFNGKSISFKKYFYAYIRTLTPKAMLGFHSQNVLQILENMKPIIFRINVTSDGKITFNKVEGMTNSQAYELMLRNGYGKEGDKPIIPIIRVSYEEVGSGYDYTMDFIATPVIFFSSSTKPLAFTLTVPAIPIKISARLDFNAALYCRGRGADNVFIGLVVNANGNISVKYLEN
nr:MAG: hypothetical protein [Bacteriophage sp.]